MTLAEAPRATLYRSVCDTLKREIAGGRFADPEVAIARWPKLVSKTPQDRLDPQIALHDLGVVGVVKLQRLSESKDVLLTPVSGQRGSDLRLRGMAAPITMGGEDAGSRSPATTARMIRIPVSPVISVTT